MNLSEIQSSISNYMLGMDIDPGEMNRWINDAQNDLSIVARIKKTATIDIVAGQTVYTLPTDMMELVAVNGLPTNTLGSNPLDMAPYIGPAYSLWGNTMTLMRTPQTDGTMTLYYFGTPTTLVTNTDVSAIPEQFHHAIVLYAAAQAKRKYAQMGDAEEYDKQYQMAKAELALFVRLQEGPHTIQEQVMY